MNGLIRLWPCHTEVGARYHRMKQHGVIVIDWSENYFNGIGRGP